MTKSIIREIYYGNRGSSDSIKMSEKCLSLAGKSIEKEKLLLPKLDGEAIELYKKIIDLSTKSHSEETLLNFTEGFKLGLLIGIECMKEE